MIDAELTGAADEIARLMGGNPKGAAPAVLDDETLDAAASESEQDELSGDAADDLDAGSDDDLGEESEDEPVEKKHKVRVRGKDEEVTYDELIAGYSRQADYTQSKQELAEQRRSFEGERQQLGTERAQYGAALNQLRTIIEQATTGAVPDIALLDTDPQSYMRQKVVYDQSQAQLAAVRAEEQRIAGLRQAEHQRRTQELLVLEEQRLLEALPEWQKPETRQAEQSALIDYAIRSGYTKEMVMNATSHLDIVTLHKAMKYDQLQTKGRETVKTAPKTAAPGSTRTGESRRRAHRQKQERFQKSHSVTDAAALIKDMMQPKR
jgi:hypothetical protein